MLLVAASRVLSGPFERKISWCLFSVFTVVASQQKISKSTRAPIAAVFATFPSSQAVKPWFASLGVKGVGKNLELLVCALHFHKTVSQMDRYTIMTEESIEKELLSSRFAKGCMAILLCTMQRTIGQ
ncbi:hypothetical protein E8E14_002340 [Neopestalotiopsis sp. 37M]|nr:hypothetical protein E8E14_002340 [Neopestalotiopsis sp. 37M]